MKTMRKISVVVLMFYYTTGVVKTCSDVLRRCRIIGRFRTIRIPSLSRVVVVVVNNDE